jgi:hypothetical protein
LSAAFGKSGSAVEAVGMFLLLGVILVPTMVIAIERAQANGFTDNRQWGRRRSSLRIRRTWQSGVAV